MGLERWEVRISLVIYIWLFMFERISTQATMKCSLPCSIGYTCFRSRHQNRGPECLAMEVYLSLVKGSSHGHTASGPRIPHTHTIRHSPRGGQTQRNLFSQHDPRLSRNDGGRVSHTPVMTGTRQQVVVDPNTGQRFALVPLQVSNTISEQGSDHNRHNHGFIAPTVQSRESLITSPSGHNSLKHVPKANTFEIQISEPDMNPGPTVSAALPDGPRPVGPLTNNREKSVLDIINELVKSAPTQTRTVENSHAENPHAENSHIENSHKHHADSTSHRHHGKHDRLPAATEMPNIRTTRETRENRGQRTGRTSAIMRDDQGYYFMFYPRTGAEGIRVKITRSGFCSRGPPSTGRRCSIRCTSDSQCHNNYKCCPNGCGLICLRPKN